jgi:hypothetical protein
MVANPISALKIRAVYVAGNAKGTLRHRTEWLPDPTQGTDYRQSLREPLRPAINSPVSSEDFL